MILQVIIPLILLIGIIPAISLNVNADYIEKFSLPYVLDPLTDSQIKDCESIYNDFISLSDFDFYTRYLTHNFSGNCVMLFEDSLWDHEGSDRYEKLSERSAELTQEHETKLKQRSENFYLESKSLTELSIPGTFLFIFEGCTGNKIININDISVISDKETVQLTAFAEEEREIPAGTCAIVEVQIRADDPSSIKLVIPILEVEVTAEPAESTTESEDPQDESQITHESPRAQVRSGIASTEVVCKEGFELLLKTNDGSPACVKKSSVDKLIERGWGKLA